MSDACSEPATIIIFGASGDLTRSKLVPALYELRRQGRLPAGTGIVGFSRRPYIDKQFREHLRQGAETAPEIESEPASWERFAADVCYIRGDGTHPDHYRRLQGFLRTQVAGPDNRLFYLATPPELYAPIVQQLGAADMAREEGGWETPGALPLETYERGSWGPPGADALVTRDGRSWRRGCCGVHE